MSHYSNSGQTPSFSGNKSLNFVNEPTQPSLNSTTSSDKQKATRSKGKTPNELIINQVVNNKLVSSSMHNESFDNQTHWSDPNEWINIFNEEHSLSPSLKGSNAPQTHYLGSNPYLRPPPNMIPSSSLQINSTTLAVPSLGKQKSSSGYEKKKVSDAVTYGPRFCTIFHAYCKAFNLTIDITKHLLVLCLENLIDFIKWARESDAQIKWINELLYENDYLRPEVRNGIVMVLIYTFASIKATVKTTSDNVDMFTTLQDNDTGLGIANKFSLKIYNDPLNYLTLLKVSISALIDAGVIPDNERQNQPNTLMTKKTKPVTYSPEELHAYIIIRQRIIKAIEEGNQQEAKHVAQVVTTHWQLRGNAIRNRRFVSALQVLSEPGISDINQKEYNELMQRAREKVLKEDGSNPNLLTIQTEHDGVTPRGKKRARNEDSDGENQEDGSYIDEDGDYNPDETANSQISSVQMLPPQQTSSLSTQNTPSLQMSPPHDYSQIPSYPLVQPPLSNPSHTPFLMSNNSFNSNSNSNHPMNNVQSLPAAPVYPYNTTNNPNQLIVIGGKVGNQPLDNTSSNSNPSHLVPTTTAVGNPSLRPVYIPPTAPQSIPPSIVPVVLPVTKTAPIIPFSLRIMRFERVGITEWDIKESRIFDINHFIQSLSIFQNTVDINIFLLNEKKITNLLKEKKFILSSSSSSITGTMDSFGTESNRGLISLENELNKLNTIVTNWPKYHLLQFEHFLRSYENFYQEQVLQRQSSKNTSNPSNNNNNNNSNLSVFQFWSHLDHEDSHDNHNNSSKNNNQIENLSEESEEIHNLSQSNTTTGTTITTTTATNENKGVIGYLGYEISIYLVLIIRKNEQLGIHSDIWCKIYPNELIHANEEIRAQQIAEGLPSTSFISFGQILMNFFPQLLSIEKRLQTLNRNRLLEHQQQQGMNSSNTATIPSFTVQDILIKYYSFVSPSSASSNSTNTAGSSNINNSSTNPSNNNNNSKNSMELSQDIHSMMNNFVVPNMVSYQSYQTIGTYSTSANKVMARMLTGALIHDFVMELVGFD